MMGHWIYSTFDPADWFGFVYIIIKKDDGKSYIGKKNFKSYTTKKPPPGKVNRIKKWKESNWKTYTGSSEDLNDDIKKYGQDAFEYFILKLCSTKGSLYYQEMAHQFSYDVLRKKLDDGTPAFYNRCIGDCINFIPPDD